MKRILFILVALLMLSTSLFGSRSSDDIVTATNSAFNNYIQDVIGNKNDTTNGNSVISLIKSGSAGNTNMQNNIDIIEVTVTNTQYDITNMQNNVDIIEVTVTNIASDVTNLDNLQSIPASDSVDNIRMRDVIGNKTDTHDGDSIYSIVETLNDNAHKASKVWPSGADGTNLLSDDTVWVATNYTNELVPATTIVSDFDVHYIVIEALSANGVYEITLQNMTTRVEIGRVRAVKNAAQDGTMAIPIQTPIQPANSRIGAQLRNSAGSGATATISIIYHTY